MPEIRTRDSMPNVQTKHRKSKPVQNVIAPKVEGAIRQKTQEHRSKQEASNEYAVGVTEEVIADAAIETAKIPDRVAQTITDVHNRYRDKQHSHIYEIQQEQSGHRSNPQYRGMPEYQRNHTEQNSSSVPQKKTNQHIKTLEKREVTTRESEYTAPKTRTRYDSIPIKTKDTTTQAKTAQSAASKTVTEYGRARFKHESQKKAAKTSKQAAKKSIEWSKKAGEAIVKTVKSVVSFIVQTFGIVGLLVCILGVILIGIIASSPLGIFFSNEPTVDSVALSSAVAQINMELNRRLTALQTGNYTSVDINGSPPDWVEVVAVFASLVAGAEDGVDVAVLTPDRVSRLKAVFWQMCYVTSSTETVTIPDSNPDDEIDDSRTEVHLTISIIAKSADDMRIDYGFTDFQNETLDILLSDRVSLSLLISSVTIDDEEALKLLEALPADLSQERRAVVQQALGLVGKVNYFWGGKSLVIGWDSRWGKLTKVTSAGSPTTGTYRPYGLDCSGFVDWVFYNTSGGSYVIGRGGGAGAQHRNCAQLSWGSVQPGDLVFYPNDDHVGIVGGKSETGHWLIIHCTSGRNNVVITDSSGFMTVGKPLYFTQ